MEDKRKLKLELRPSLPVALIPTIIFSVLLGSFLSIFIANFFTSFIRDEGGLFGLVWFFIWLVSDFIIIFLILFFRIMNLKARKYIFYNDEAVFYEGFLNIIQRTVPYSKVTDFVLVKSVWSRLFGTGNIKLITAGHEFSTTNIYGAGGGIVIQYIKNPDEIYNKLKKIIHKG